MSFEVAGIVSRKVCGGHIRRGILMAMASRADDEGGNVWASIKTLARDAEMSEATTRRTIRELLKEGVVKACGQRPCKYGYTVLYAFDMAKLLALPSLPRSYDEAVKQFAASSDEPPLLEEPLSRGQGVPPVRETGLPLSERQPKISNEASIVEGDAHTRDDLASVKQRCFAALGPGAADPARTPTLHTTANSIAAWVRHGCDLDADILPTIAALTAQPRGSPISTWRFFEQAIYRARDLRLAPPPPPSANPFPTQSTGAFYARQPAAQPQSAAAIAMERWRARERLREAGGAG